MALHPGAAEMLATAADIPMVSAAEDMSKKVRKPYTITKSRESWTEQEHDKFLEALQLFDRDWKKIEAFVGSKTVIQIRSHAQKYFLKVQKNGTGEHVPPPRPKRKSAQPYPQKAPKSGPATQGATSMSLTEPAYPVSMQACAAPPASSASAMPAWVHHMAPPGSVGFANKALIPATGVGPTGSVLSKDQNGIKVENSSVPSQKLTTMSQGSGEIVLRAMPDFTEVYSFLGSVFDPSANCHLEKMREMAPIDRETVLLLMRNLSINLSSADFEEHKLFLSVYDMEPEEPLPGAEDDLKSLSDAPVASRPPLDGGDDTLVSGYCELRQVSESREVMSESDADETGEHTLRCHPEEELTSSTTGVSKAFVGNGQCLQLSQTPLFLEQQVQESPSILKFPSVPEDGEPDPPMDPFEEAELDDSKGEAEIVDMWWS
ncbi:hypothetical protein GOP47_0025419 [Adiantum capillus-veneris]|uniref:MYB transcription factor n=1 Tax=Adiantum capillus-veneris TaxID=13818 RepID=A0A9D4U1F2_ADICA|nr:hypothetical protein GOP47_0025419 [Adiantum capillus-veneris]